MKKNKKTIWIINNTAGSPKHGMVYRNFYIAKYLKKLGHDVYIISATFNHQFYSFPDNSKNLNYEIIEKIPYCWLKVPEYKSNNIGRLISIFSFLQQFKKHFKAIKFDRPDVVIASAPTPMLGSSALLLKKHFKSSFVYEFRDIWPLTLTEIGGMSRFHPFVLLMRFFEKRSYQKADLIVSVVINGWNHVKKNGVEKKRYIAIPNGREIEKISNTSMKLPKTVEAVLSRNTFKIVYIGAHGIANVLDSLIHSARYLTDIPVDIILIGDGQEKQNLLKIARPFDNIFALDPVNKELIPTILHRIDVGYVAAKDSPLYQYGYSATKVFDYMHESKPIIYAVNAKPNLVLEGNCGLAISSSSEAEIAMSIRKFYNMDKEKLHSMGKNGRVYLEKYFSYETLAKNYSVALENLPTTDPIIQYGDILREEALH